MCQAQLNQMAHIANKALNTGFISTMFYIQHSQVIFATLAKCECFNLFYKAKWLTFGFMETL